MESDLEIIGDQNCKRFESGTGDLNAEPELELADPVGVDVGAEPERRAGPGL